MLVVGSRFALALVIAACLASCAPHLSTTPDRIRAFAGGTTEGALARSYLAFLDDSAMTTDNLLAAEELWLETHPWGTGEALADARRDLAYVKTLLATGMDDIPEEAHPRLEILTARLESLDARAVARHQTTNNRRVLAAVNGEPRTALEARGYWQAQLQSDDESIRALAAERLDRLAAAAAEPASSRSNGGGSLAREIAGRAKASVVAVTVGDGTGADIGRASGVVVGASDLVITNYHVVEDANEASVRTVSGGEHAVAGVLQIDERADLALLHVPGLNAPPIALHDGAAIEVGDRVIALGSPQGLEGTVSEGIISAVRRLPQMQVPVLQTTAPLSEGSSGGALISAEGQLVGVTTLVSKTGQNLNFAVPSTEVGRLLKRRGTEKRKAQDWPGQGLSRLTPDRLFDASKRALESGDIEEASRLCEAGLKSNPGHPAMLVCVVVTRSSLCDRAGALNALDLLKPIDEQAWSAGMALIEGADRDGMWARCKKNRIR